MATPRKPPSNGWKKGQSGNPAGRPVGCSKVAKLRESIAGQIPSILARLVELALEGDTAAARLLLERSVAPLKAAETAQALHLPNGTLTEQGRAVLGAVASGELAPGQGSQLISAIAGLARVAELDELASRISALEQAGAHHGDA